MSYIANRMNLFIRLYQRTGLGSYFILKVHSLQAAVTILVKFLRSENLGLVFIFDPTGPNIVTDLAGWN